MDNKILIVASSYYKDITANLIKGSKEYLKKSKINFDLIYAPGCYEIPLLLKKNINKYSGFISLGCIIRGETYHFEIIANECGRKIMDLSLQYEKPIGFGILTCENLEQAIIRSDPLKKNKGLEATIACVSLLETKKI